MRLIDADKIDTRERGNNSQRTMWSNIKKIIDEAPTVEERPKGIWVRTGQSFVDPNKFRNFCCSNCSWELDEHIRTEPNFCPNCGADMRGKEE